MSPPNAFVFELLARATSRTYLVITNQSARTPESLHPTVTDYALVNPEGIGNVRGSGSYNLGDPRNGPTVSMPTGSVPAKGRIPNVFG